MCVPGARIRKGAFTKSSSFLLSFICEPMFKRQKLLKDLEMKLRFCKKYTADRKTLVCKKKPLAKTHQEKLVRKELVRINLAERQLMGQNLSNKTQLKKLIENVCLKVTSIKSI